MKRDNSKVAEIIVNGLQDLAMMPGPGIGGGFQPFGLFPGNQGTGWSNPTSSANTTFVNLRYYLVSNFRQILNQMYAEFGLIQTIVDVPVDDGFRGGIDIKSKQLSDEEIEELQISLDRDDDLNTSGQAIKWNRLFGGAGELILTDQNPAEPLDVERINIDSALEFRAVDMWELFWDKQSDEGYDATTQNEDVQYFNYYGIQVHKSRVMRLKGITAPSFIRPRLRGWGLSVVEKLVRSLNQYLKSTDLIFQVLDEFKIDVYKIKNFNNTLSSPIGTQKVQQRIQLANFLKNYQNALVMDSEDDWDHKQLNFAGLAEMLEQIYKMVAADMRMPITKIFGVSAAGFNSGEDDIEVYNAMVESEVRNKAKYNLLRKLELKCQKLFGYIPDDLSFSFKPLRVMTSEQEQNAKTQEFTRLSTALTQNAITLEEFRDACNKADIFPIKLDSQETLNPDNGDTVAEGAQNPDVATDNVNPGANRADSRKSKATETGGAGTEPEPPKDAPNPDGDKSYDRRKDNSAGFDRASYEADGGDSWIDPRRKYFFENPNGKVDESIWARAKEASRAAFGTEKWQFVTWWYEKHGGKFKQS